MRHSTIEEITLCSYIVRELCVRFSTNHFDVWTKETRNSEILPDSKSCAIYRNGCLIGSLVLSLIIWESPALSGWDLPAGDRLSLLIKFTLLFTNLGICVSTVSGNVLGPNNQAVTWSPIELSFLRIAGRGKETCGMGKWVAMLIQTMVSQRCAEGSLVAKVAVGGLAPSVLRTQWKPWTTGEFFGASGSCTEMLPPLSFSAGHPYISFVPGGVSLPFLQYNCLFYS